MLLESARRALSSYQPTDPREAGFKERIERLLRSSAPFSRSSFEPGHLTASAFVVSPGRDAVLLILHRKLGLWLQPGGHIEVGDESLEAAARREVLEEVQVKLAEGAAGAIFDVDVHAIPARKDEPAHEHFDVRFCFQAAAAEIAPNEEVAGARWAELRGLEQVTSDESVLRAARKLMQS
jgi:8-oxo-dGTP pyrophosphatase MutT (NUDIX family)